MEDRIEKEYHCGFCNKKFKRIVSPRYNDKMQKNTHTTQVKCDAGHFVPTHLDDE